ncbi:hypothetical protein FM076_27680 [Streptomyces albus subsp. chlorinus]|uniref:hypothetical protein n=1 Tax=Streptomyces albus TaxID=1888 RepID=UPI00156D64EA|nr:hypothetical protein [Streptomyces albus subsp. chlorinus]
MLFHTAGAVLAPLCAMALAYWGASYAVNGGPHSSVYFGNAAVTVAFFGALASGFLTDTSHPLQPFVAIVTSLVLALGVVAVSSAVEKEAMRLRGVSTRCTVLDVDRQVHTSTYTDSNGISHTTTTVDYKHRLDCAAGRPDTMTRDEKKAGKGEHLQVTYDPRGRMEPLPTRDLKGDGSWRTLALVCLPAVVGVRVLAVLAAVGEHRRARRRLYQRYPYLR